VELRVKKPPRRFVSPFEMQSVRSSIVTPRAIPFDAERPIATSKRAQDCNFQRVGGVDRAVIFLA